MKRILNILLIVLVAVAALSVVLWLVQGGGERGVQLMLTVAYVYLALAALLAIVMTAMNLGKSQSGSKVGLWVFGGLAVVAVILYFTIASSTAIVGADNKVYDDVFTLKISDTMLYTAYVALGVTVLALIVGEIRKALK